MRESAPTEAPFPKFRHDDYKLAPSKFLYISPVRPTHTHSRAHETGSKSKIRWQQLFNEVQSGVGADPVAATSTASLHSNVANKL